MRAAKVLVLAGDGINCERETAAAFRLAGFEVSIIHINDVSENPNMVLLYQVLAFPGGFSFGDELGSGQILALKIQMILGDVLKKFVDKKNPIIGICNGFQALTKLNLLPNKNINRCMAIAANSSGAFMNKWVSLERDSNTVCIWTSKMSENVFYLPIRHGEGRVKFKTGQEEIIHRDLTTNGQIVLRYQEEVNGSYARIAGICDPTGLIFGLMPHPEAAINKIQYPNSSRLENRYANGIGLDFFINCFEYVKEK